MLAGVVVVLVNVYYCITALLMHMVDEMEKVFLLSLSFIFSTLALYLLSAD